MTESLSFIKAGGIGLIMGIIGVIVGFLPVMFLKNYLGIFGFPLPWAGIIILPIGSALFGIIGTSIAWFSSSQHIWLWGSVAGLLFNFCVSFWAQ